MSMRTSQGFTLIELLLYVSVTSIVLVATIFFILSLLEVREKNTAIATVDAESAHVVTYVGNLVRNAESITTPIEGVSGATLIVDDGSQNVTVALDGTTVVVTEGGGSAVALTTSAVEVSNLSFDNRTRTDTGGTVQMSFTVRYAVPSTSRQIFQYEKDITHSATIRFAP